jgi:RimJ/RimL family protein N-acetyltransferase
MSYSVLRQQKFSFEDYLITTIRMEDRYAIMRWRNEQLDILRQKEPLTIEQQDRYFKEVVCPQMLMKSPGQILVSIFKAGQLIGYGGLVHIHWQDRRGEISFILETSRNSDTQQFQVDYSAYLTMIKSLAFDELKFNKITTEAFDLRPYLIETLESNGFVLEGRLKDQNFINGRFVDSLLHACFNPKRT